MKALKYIVFALTCFFTLLSCTPSFESTASMCETNLPLSLEVESYQVKTSEGYEEEGGQTQSEYKLYLEEIIHSMKDMQQKDHIGGDMSPEAQQMLDFFFAKAKEHMGYEITDGNIDFADNPLDYMEFLISAIDEDEKIGSFEQAREQMALGVENDDGFCNYRNDRIDVFKVDNNDNKFDSLDVILDMSYHPGDPLVKQTIVMSFTDQDLAAEEIVEATPITGLYVTRSEDFKEVGMGESYLRQASILTDETERFVVDISTDFKSDVVADIITNSFCMEGDNKVECTDLSNVREVQHDSCRSDSDEDHKENETDMVQINTFDIIEGQSDYSDLHRFKVKVDYETEEVHFYISKYNEVILRAGYTLEEVYDGDTINLEKVITNPTDCEKQAVRVDLFDALPEDEKTTVSGVSFTRVPDRNYDDYFLDAEGNLLDEDSEEAANLDPSTTPIFTFTGTAIPSRQE